MTAEELVEGAEVVVRADAEPPWNRYAGAHGTVKRVHRGRQRTAAEVHLPGVVSVAILLPEELDPVRKGEEDATETES